MTNRFLVSVAALALIAGTGFANAQGTGHESGGAQMQNAPSSAGGGAAGGSAIKHSESAKGMNRSSAEKSSTTGQSQRAEEKTPGQKSKSMSSENETKAGEKNMKAEGREGLKGEKNAKSHEGLKGEKSAKSHEGLKGEKNAQTKSGRESEKSAQGQNLNNEKNAQGQNLKNEKNAQGQTRTNEMNAKGQNRTNEMNAQGPNRTNGMNAQERTGGSQTTVGVAGSAAKLSTDQRTRIVNVIRGEHVAPINNVDFAVSVGTRVPRERVHLRTLPTQVVDIYPEWRGYEFFMVRDEIVVVDPNSLEIVAVLPA